MYCRSLTWVNHIKTEGKQLKQKAKELHWLPEDQHDTKYSNPNVPMEISYGEQPPTPISKSSSVFSPRLSDPF
jgi:hypothetical protein